MRQTGEQVVARRQQAAPAEEVPGDGAAGNAGQRPRQTQREAQAGDEGGEDDAEGDRITSYNVCYTKLLRAYLWQKKKA